MTCKILLLLLFQNLSTMAENYVPLVTREFLQSLGTVKLVPFWLELYYLIAAVYIIFKILIFAPPPLLIYISSPNKNYYNENCQSFFLKFCIFQGENMHFPPFFHPLSIFFSPTCYLAIFLPTPPPGGGGGAKEKNNPPP